MTNEEFNVKVSRLPIWAIQYIHKLESDVNYYKEALQAYSTGVSPIRCTDSLNPPVGLPERNTIEMDVRGGTLELVLRNGVLELRADRAVIVQSSSGNVLRAWVTERGESA